MERHAFIVNVRPERRADYLRLHAAVWPQVEAQLTACNITNYSIFLVDDTLVGYYEYVGSDHAADLRRVGTDETTREWWKLTDPCQVRFGGEEGPEVRWREMEEIWHLP